MKQILQSLKTGTTQVADIPCPRIRPGHIFIRTSRTLVSAGTERMLVDFGKGNLLQKAWSQPEKVKQVLDKIRSDGLMPTVEAVFNKLDQPLPLGYCNVGTVINIHPLTVDGQFKEGDRVASNGQHAEMVSVPNNLCVKVPDIVSDDEAAFTVIASIGLQGIRLAHPTIGETVVVTGLGLIGLVTVQLLRANGCRVLGIDFDANKIALAKEFGAEVVNLSSDEDPIAIARTFSRGRGVDAVIITAATKSSEPVHQAALMCRKRGRIVLVGVTGLELSRADFYEKELSFQVSCSYGPGRYDPNYEEKGFDYPVGFVRWTEQRNFEAVLDMMSNGQLNVKPLISHHFPIDKADQAYDLITSVEASLGILLEYPTPEQKLNAELCQTTVKLAEPVYATDKAVVAFIGSGNYATAVLIPAFKAAGVRLKSVASSGGVSGVHAGRKFGFEQTTTDSRSIFTDLQINTIIITTRHNSHAEFVINALAANKHVFVEKPLCLSSDELIEICKTYESVQNSTSKPPLLMVGFNRRFAPHVLKIKALLESVKEPKVFVMTVNAGEIPPDHWTQDISVGGGRIVGECCHFIDLLRFIADSPISGFHTLSMGTSSGVKVTEDKACITLSFEDGSIGTVHYLANGHKSFPKERLDIFTGGRILQLDNFRKLSGFGWPNFKKMNLWRQDKGQKACASAFIQSIEQGGISPIPFQEIIEVSRVTIEIANSLR